MFAFTFISFMLKFLENAFEISIFNQPYTTCFIRKAEQLIEKYDAFLHLLLEAEVKSKETALENIKRIDREEVLGQCLIFFFVGMESILTAICNSL
jgi:hypothetical protein